MNNRQTSSFPKAKKECKKIRTHGDVREDCYTWLRSAKAKRVHTHLELENAYTAVTLKASKKLQTTLYKEMKSRMKEEDVSVPIKNGPYYYYARTKKNAQYVIHCRKRGLRGKEEIILDENKLAKENEHFSLGSLEVHPDHQKILYTVDSTGDEYYELFVKDLQTGKVVDRIKRSVGSAVWTQDGEHIIYASGEHPHIPRKVFLHSHKKPKEKDVLVHEEKDSSWCSQVELTRSKEYILISNGTFKESEIFILPAKAPFASKPLRLAKRKSGVYYYVEHQGDYLYIVTNEDAPNYKIMRTRVDQPEKKYWKEWLPHSTKRSVSGLVPFESFMVIGVREGGSSEIKVFNPKGGSHYVPLPEKEHSVSLFGESDFSSKNFLLGYSSFLTPSTTYQYTPHTQKLVVKKQRKVPGFKRSKYVSKRIWVANDGVKIPVELFYKKGTKLDGSAPALLSAYGSYGINIDPWFSIDRISLVDRGWIMALAHPRGGGEMGELWHKQAYLLTKKKTAEDFVAVAKKLGSTITTPKRLAISGGSAGGMLMGMVANTNPECCGAILAYVPAADVMTSMLDPTLPGTEIHYSEVGDPRKKSHYLYMKSYCPYENVRTQDYPPMLVRASFHDIRTPYWESAKWVAKLREHAWNPENILLLVELSAGHSGKSGRYEWLKNRALDYAFLIKTIEGK